MGKVGGGKAALGGRRRSQAWKEKGGSLPESQPPASDGGGPPESRSREAPGPASLSALPPDEFWPEGSFGGKASAAKFKPQAGS